MKPLRFTAGAVAAMGAALMVAAPAVHAADSAAGAPRLVRLGASPTLPSALAAARGGSSDAVTPMSQAVLNGRISDAQAVNTGSGNNTIAGGALAGMTGLPVVIQNSGNNVLIQNATIVNVTVK